MTCSRGTYPTTAFFTGLAEQNSRASFSYIYIYSVSSVFGRGEIQPCAYFMCLVIIPTFSLQKRHSLALLWHFFGTAAGRCVTGTSLCFLYELHATDRCWIGSPTETDTPGQQPAQVVTVPSVWLLYGTYHFAARPHRLISSCQIALFKHFFWAGVVIRLVHIMGIQPKLIQDFISFFLFFFLPFF